VLQHLRKQRLVTTDGRIVDDDSYRNWYACLLGFVLLRSLACQP
jgi:hypothetical protein